LLGTWGVIFRKINIYCGQKVWVELGCVKINFHKYILVVQHMLLVAKHMLLVV
jgi:hypothetical protein